AFSGIAVDVGQHDLVALGSKAARQCEPDPAAGSGHHSRSCHAQNLGVRASAVLVLRNQGSAAALAQNGVTASTFHCPATRSIRTRRRAAAVVGVLEVDLVACWLRKTIAVALFPCSRCTATWVTLATTTACTCGASCSMFAKTPWNCLTKPAVPTFLA